MSTVYDFHLQYGMHHECTCHFEWRTGMLFRIRGDTFWHSYSRLSHNRMSHETTSNDLWKQTNQPSALNSIKDYLNRLRQRNGEKPNHRRKMFK